MTAHVFNERVSRGIQAGQNTRAVSPAFVGLWKMILLSTGGACKQRKPRLPFNPSVGKMSG